MRLKRPTSGKLSKEPSNHSFGIAIDLNSDDGSNGGSVAPVAPSFTRLGFRWGIEFADPMHFEVKTFIDGARPNVQEVTVKKGGVVLDLDARNAFGHVMVPVTKAESAFGMTRISVVGNRVKLSKDGVARTLTMETFGDRGFVLLTEVVSMLGMIVVWDNATKTAILG